MGGEKALPTHIGIIMDGNGRWAKKRGLPRNFGHRAGANTFRTIARYANQIGLSYLTFYVFSTENWKRSQEEVGGIMTLLRNYLDEMDAYAGENIKVKFWGNLLALPEDIRQKMKRAEKETENATGVQLNLAINYGGRADIVQATQQLMVLAKEGKIDPEQVTEDVFRRFLYSGEVPDVDLIIRPSGEYRLSNFLIWQSAYAEYVFMDILWPDFKPASLDAAIREYQNRSRRFGGV